MNSYEDEYNYIYGDEKNEYDEIYDEQIYDKIQELKGSIGRGDCLYCGAKNAMIYVGGVCFICMVCKKSVHEDTYYAWAAGCNVNTEE